MTTIEKGDIYLKIGSTRTIRIVEEILPPHARCRKPNGTPVHIPISTLIQDYKRIGRVSNIDAPIQPQPIRNIIIKGAGCYDAKGAPILPTNFVIDSFGNQHEVLAIEPIDEDHAWLITTNREKLIPHLTEKV